MKLPPIEKVYEAWSAIADERVALLPGGGAKVISSSGAKEYTVRYDAATDTYSSNDSATYWRGYPGYPVIAVMMLERKLPFDLEQSNLWGDINWTELNAAHRRNYAAAVAQVEAERGIDAAAARSAAQTVMDAIAASPVHVKRLS